MKNNRNGNGSLFVTVITLFLLFSSCAPQPTSTPTKTLTHEPDITPTVTPVHLPALTLEPGEFYFRVDGTQRMLFSRNPAGNTQEDFNFILDWSRQGGSKILRIHLTIGWSGNPWITTTGAVNESWAKNWDHFFDQAEAEGIWIIPVFGVWFEWNDGIPDYGSPGWKYNPLNSANGGPFTEPGELFKPDSPTQKVWMEWVKTLVKRWEGRRNIAAWEIFSEINIASGEPGNTDEKGAVAEPVAEDFANRLATMIHAADKKHRPVTLSLAVGSPGTDQWAKFYDLKALDFIQIHPYSAQLDRELISEVLNNLRRYNKPVLIGESGLWGETAILPNALIGVKHAIWADMVSGAMNARALWSNDGWAFYEPDRTMALEYMKLYATVELPVVNFTNGVNFSGFTPLVSTSSLGVWGAAVGNEKIVLGWFRDAVCEPPDWTVQPIPAGKTVTITVPRTTVDWKVEFYDTRTGTTIVGSTSATRQGSTLTVTLPGFQDDIAFKMTAQAVTATVTPIATNNTNAIAGRWSGLISNQTGTFSTLVELNIQSNCEPGRVCGRFSAPQLPCSGDLFLLEITAEHFAFIEQNASGAASCISGGNEYLQLLKDGTLTYKYSYQSTGVSSTGILRQH